MKPINLLLAAAFAAAISVSAGATASVAPVLNGPSGSYAPAVTAPNLSFIGAPVYRIETSTPTDTPILLLAGQGLLYSIRCSSGSTAAYAVAYDSAVSAGITVETQGKKIAGSVYSAGLVTSTTSAQTVILGNDPGLNYSANPLPFTNGLVGLVHGGVANCYFQARLNTGANPGP